MSNTMKHHRSPTLCYPQNTTPLSIHATLALRHSRGSIPTLLSPLRPIANTPPYGVDDAADDFQSNACVSAPTHHLPLAGLGITYLCDASASFYGQPPAPENTSPHMQVDGKEELRLLAPEPRGTDTPSYAFPAPTAPFRGLESGGSRHMVRYTPDVVPFPCDERASRLELGFDGDIDLASGDIIGLIPDVNMYDRLRRLDLPYFGVNPLDTVHSTSHHDVGISHEGPASLAPKDFHGDGLLPATDSRAEQSPSSRVIQDIMSILIQPTPEFTLRPWSSTNSPRSSASIKPEPTDIPGAEHRPLPALCNLEDPHTAHSSPILNAHLGIELDELISRAERFRTKYPEQDIDRAWLSHFAGKLSNRGELLNDFRCYVIGCDQQNKRRDHILVHVGAHIGQRPFACSVCPLRFLRKNECKRHEASHSGFRPYSCDICGQSFVRQDLVKRHVKRTHGLRDENELGIAKQSRKRARLR